MAYTASISIPSALSVTTAEISTANLLYAYTGVTFDNSITSSGAFFDKIESATIIIETQDRSIDLVKELNEYRDRIVILETKIEHFPQPIKEAPMFTTINTVIIVLIVVVTVKFIIPKLTWKYFFKRLVGFIRPAKKEFNTAKGAWDDANKDD